MFHGWLIHLRPDEGPFVISAAIVRVQSVPFKVGVVIIADDCLDR